MAKAVQEAEDARLFYVACTRTEERLLICLNGASRQGRWSKWTQALILQDPAVNLVDAADLSEAQAAPPQALARDWPGFLPPGPGEEQKAAARVLAQSLYRPPAKLGLVRESVSGLENFFACPRLYLMTQRLALDTAALPGKSQSGGLARAVELGSLVHHLLEVCDLKAGPTGLPEALATLQPDPELAKQALLLAKGLWDTELPGLLEKVPPQDLHRELSFNLLLAAENGGADLELIGELDLAARLPGGGWLIADYKVSNKADPEPYHEQLGLYALALYKGQDDGPAPQAALCFLGSKGGVLKRLQFSPDDLAALEQRVRQAANDIAALGAVMDPFRLEPGPACAQGKCPLAWLCGPGKAGP